MKAKRAGAAGIVKGFGRPKPLTRQQAKTELSGNPDASEICSLTYRQLFRPSATPFSVLVNNSGHFNLLLSHTE
ncbi:MAG: hypothetical protein V7739_18045, partial [Motiliproteus sp.]